MTRQIHHQLSNGNKVNTWQHTPDHQERTNTQSRQRLVQCAWAARSLSTVIEVVVSSDGEQQMRRGSAVLAGLVCGVLQNARSPNARERCRRAQSPSCHVLYRCVTEGEGHQSSIIAGTHGQLCSGCSALSLSFHQSSIPNPSSLTVACSNTISNQRQ